MSFKDSIALFVPSLTLYSSTRAATRKPVHIIETCKKHAQKYTVRTSIALSLFVLKTLYKKEGMIP